jgi:peptidoglycan/LPS O-acetylase OafA/YrhL
LTPSAQRLPGIDALKALACVLIVLHHLVFYGPMSDVVHGAAPALMNWLYVYGRMAVQVFLVVGGFLAAAALEPRGLSARPQSSALLVRRYFRLAVPLMVAIMVTIAVSAAVRPWFVHPSVPDAPGVLQLLAHVFLLQDVLGYEALSAGIWYVAIDFQLFVLSVGLFIWVPPTWRSACVLAGAAASLLVFNRYPGLDMTGLYFFGSYALGTMAWWAARSSQPWRWLAVMVLLVTAALLLDFRGRLLVALLVALALVVMQRRPWAARYLQGPWLQRLGEISYSVFLIHFAVCLLVNALVTHLWPAQLLANSVGMASAFVLSLIAGWVLYRVVESPRAGWRGLRLGPISPRGSP